MDAITAAEARQHFAEILNQVAYGKKRMILTRRGKKLAAVVPVEDLETLKRIEDKQDLEDARKALAEVRKRHPIAWDTIKRERKRKP